MNSRINWYFTAIAKAVALVLFAAVTVVARLLFPRGAAQSVALPLELGLIVSRESVADMFRGFQTVFNDAFGRITPAWERIAFQVPSTGSEEKYGWLRNVPAMREWIGDRQIKSLELAGYTIVNKDFESTVGVKRNDIEDDKYGLMSPAVRMMGDEAARHPDKLIFPLLTGGFANTCYDGQFFFDSDHPVGSGTYSNTGGGSGAGWYLLDTTRPILPLVWQVRKPYDFQAMNNADDEAVFMRKEFRMGVDARVNAGYGLWQLAYGSRQTLDTTAFNAAYASMMATPNDNGDPLGIRPTLLVCGPSNRSAALTVLEREFEAAGANNINFKAVDVLISPYLP